MKGDTLERSHEESIIAQYERERRETDPMARWLQAIEATVTTYVVPGIDTRELDPVVVPALIAQALDMLATDEHAMANLIAGYRDIE